MDALLAQGKPIPSAERFELDKQQAMVPMEAGLMFGNAPYATAGDLAGIYYGPGGGGGGAGSAELVQLVRQQGDLLKDVSASLQLLSTQISDLGRGGLGSGGLSSSKPDAWIATLSQASSDMRSEINSIKALLLAKDGAGAGAGGAEIAAKLSVLETKVDAADAALQASPGSPLDSLLAAAKNGKGDAPAPGGEAGEAGGAAEEAAPATLSPDEVAEQKMDAARRALTKMVEACPADKLKPALSTLLMYFRNLAKEPQVPRYGRIARTNAAYTKALGDVPHHQEFLAAHGFEDRASGGGAARSPTLEWSEEWRNNADAWAVKVLKDSIKNLEAVVNVPAAAASTSANANANANATANANASATDLKQAEAAFLAKEAEPSKSEPSKSEPSKTQLSKTSPMPSKAGARSAAPFTAAPFQLPGTPAAASPSPAAPAPAAQAPQAPGQAPGAAAPQDEDRYPLSYAEVMRLVKEGKEPPGIRKIPPSLSMDADNPSQPALQPLPKPWERGPDPSTGRQRVGTPQGKDQSGTYHASLFANDNGEADEEEEEEAALQRGLAAAHLLPVGGTGVEFEELSTE
jgi:hypothetical protein